MLAAGAGWKLFDFFFFFLGGGGGGGGGWGDLFYTFFSLYEKGGLHNHHPQ